MANISSRIAENYAHVRQRMEAAAARAGRSSAEIKLIAVTKYVSVEVAGLLFEAGCRDFGESRPQELWQKAAAFQSRDVTWHMIGHLQRNKVRRTLPIAALLHSCDRVRLLEEINRVAGELGIASRILLEVNISGDETKHGFAPDSLATVIDKLPAYGNVNVGGLMAMASLHGDLAAARRDFTRLRMLRDELSTQLPDGVDLDQLSMGMSRDFEVAIEEGATIVRVGSALFEGIEP